MRREADVLATSAPEGRGGASRSDMANLLQNEDPYVTPTGRLRELIAAKQQEDAFVQGQLRRLHEVKDGAKGADTLAYHQSSDGILLGEGKPYVPNDQRLKAALMERYHDDPSAGHYGVAKTTSMISRVLYWPTLSRDVKDYVLACDVCQRHKARRHRPYGVLQPLSIPAADEVLQHWSMDFVVGLPPADSVNGVVDAILVMVDRLSKYAIYVAVNGTTDARRLADVFESAVVTKYGPPLSVLTDRGTLFTSKFWSEMCWRWKAQRRLSTAFHPQTDGQTERQNQIMETYLRCYINYH